MADRISQGRDWAMVNFVIWYSVIWKGQGERKSISNVNHQWNYLCVEVKHKDIKVSRMLVSGVYSARYQSCQLHSVLHSPVIHHIFL